MSLLAWPALYLLGNKLYKDSISGTVPVSRLLALLALGCLVAVRPPPTSSS